MRNVRDQIQTFLGLQLYEKLHEHLRHFLDGVASCLTEFFHTVSEPGLDVTLDDACLRVAKDVAVGLVEIANSSDYPTVAQVDRTLPGPALFTPDRCRTRGALRAVLKNSFFQLRTAFEDNP